MEDTKTAITLNLSNQTNTLGSKKADLFQYNCFVILGLDYLENDMQYDECIPTCIRLNRQGELTIKGLDEDIINTSNIRIYSDRKVTTSED